MIKASNRLEARVVPKTATQRLLKNIWDYREMYLLVIPVIVYVFVFSYMPMYGIIIAFQDAKLANGFGASQWLGLYHFKRFFNGIYFERLMVNTFATSIWSHIGGMPVCLAFALLLHNSTNQKIKKFSQSLTYIPSLLSVVLIMTIVRLFIDRRGGLVNILFAQWGMEPIDFFALPEAVIPIYVLSGIWSGTGSGCIIYLGALSSVDEEMVEAARIDGASKLRIIFSIQLPSILPTLVTMLILNMGSIFAVGAEKMLLIQTALNQKTSEVIGTYVYKCGIASSQYGFAAAIGMFSNIINVTMVAIVNWISDRITGMGII